MDSLLKVISPNRMVLLFQYVSASGGGVSSATPVKFGKVDDSTDYLTITGASILPQDQPFQSFRGPSTLEVSFVEGTRLEVPIILTMYQARENVKEWTIGLTEQEFIDAAMKAYGDLWFAINKLNMLGIK